MRGFRGKLRQLLRASLQQRALAGSSYSICQCPNALGLRTTAVQQLGRTVWRGPPGLQNLPFGLRGLRCSRLSLESVNVEVASFGESITGRLQLAPERDFRSSKTQDLLPSLPMTPRSVAFACRGVHCWDSEKARGGCGGR